LTADITKVLDCDIIVLGAGGGGLVAAARASALSDKKIIIVEKAARSGGGASGAGDFRVYNSKWQKERGLDDSLQTDLLKFMDETYWKLDRELVLNTFLATGEFFDWCCTLSDDVADHWKPGRYIFDFPDKGPVIPTYSAPGGGPGGPGEGPPPGDSPAPGNAGVPTKDGKGPKTPDDAAGPMMAMGMRSGTYICKLLTAYLKEKNVPILLKHKVVDFEMENNKIAAVICESEDGLVKINCKAVIMSTGSWINNQKYLEMASPNFAKLDPGPLMPGGHRNSNYTGDGIALAEKAGAYVDLQSFVIRPMGPSPKGPGGGMPGTGSESVTAMCRHPYGLQINKNGKRFTCEPSSVRLDLFYSAHIVLDQPDAVSYIVFGLNTAKAADAHVDGPTYKPAGIFGTCRFPDDIEADLASDKSVIRADTIEELAEKMGVPAHNLKATIERYNRSCEKGFDDDCFKSAEFLVPVEAPYYAAECEINTDGAFGGVLVNAKMEAYSKDVKLETPCRPFDNPESASIVEGLYVIGDFASGRFINDWGMKRQIINDLSWAFASGFIAAQSAVDYLK